MDLSQWEEAFSLFDTKGDGCIAAKQIGEVLRALGHNPTEADIKKYGFANKPEERLNFEVFTPIVQEVSKLKSPSQKPEDYTECFRHFDKDQSGTIHSSQLRHLLTTLGDRLSSEEFEQLIAGMEDSQGMINYENFIRNIISS